MIQKEEEDLKVFHVSFESFTTEKQNRETCNGIVINRQYLNTNKDCNIHTFKRAQNNQSNWTSQIKNLMEEINMGSVFRNSEICNIQQAEEKKSF